MSIDLVERAIQVSAIIKQTKIEYERDLEKLVEKCRLIKSTLALPCSHDFIDTQISMLPSSTKDLPCILPFNYVYMILCRIDGRCKYVLKERTCCAHIKIE
jgi:hypothetical protein